MKKEIEINIKNITVDSNLTKLEDTKALVIFAHGSGSSRLSPRNNFVADILNKHDIATLLTDLLPQVEDEIYENRFDISLLSNRLIEITEWALQESSLQGLLIGYFGASTGAASALQAAIVLGKNIQAVVSRAEVVRI